MEKRFYFRKIGNSMVLCVYENGRHSMATEKEAEKILPVMTSMEWPFDEPYDKKKEKIKKDNKCI